MNNRKDAQPTQQFVDIEEIKDGVIILKNGGLRKILIVSGINFELKSEDEQNIIIRAYQELLNSLDFSLQIVIHSRKSNTESYLKNLEAKQEAESNILLKDQLKEYIEFIRSFVQNNEIMTKTFFVSVPYEPNVIKESSSMFGGIFGNKKTAQEKTQEQNKSLKEQINQLDQRVDQVLSGLLGVGLRAVALNNEELIELFYNLYNPKKSS